MNVKNRGWKRQYFRETDVINNMEPTGKTYVGSDELYAEVQRTIRLCAEINTGYHTEASIKK